MSPFLHVCEFLQLHGYCNHKIGELRCCLVCPFFTRKAWQSCDTWWENSKWTAALYRKWYCSIVMFDHHFFVTRKLDGEKRKCSRRKRKLHEKLFNRKITSKIVQSTYDLWKAFCKGLQRRHRRVTARLRKTRVYEISRKIRTSRKALPLLWPPVRVLSKLNDSWTRTLHLASRELLNSHPRVPTEF